MWPVYYLNDIDFRNYSDDNIPFLFEATPENSLFEGFLNDQMKANPNQCK